MDVAVFRAPRFEVDMDAIGASDSEGFATGQAISVRPWQESIGSWVGARW